MKVANGVLCDIRHRFYQYVLYLHNMTWFRGRRANFISFTPIRKAWSSMSQVIRNSKMLNSIIMCRSLIADFTRVEKNKCGNYGQRIHCTDFHESYQF
jgi:hypothetical protein